MVQEPSKKQGTPNWADCATTDLDRAESFYATVFGWSSERITALDGAIYALQRLDGKMVAGIYELSQELRGMNVPSHWATYFEVDDVVETLKRVAQENGTVVEGPFEEPEVGTIAIAQDCVGAFLRLWHSAPHHGGEIFNVPGAMIWNELNTREPEKAAAFYEKVLGFDIEALGGATPYTLLKVDGRAVAGILKQTPDMGNFPPSWDVYFASDDVDATTAAAIAAGGKAVREPFDIPQAGARMAVLQDPLGAVFEVIRMDPSQA